METNRQLLEQLFETSQIDLKRTALFDTPPPSLPANLDFGRIEGMMLGLAIGDALGITTESMLPQQRKRYYGEIRDYLPNRYSSKSIGYPSDDTQLAFWTLEQINKDMRFNPEHVAKRFCQGHIFGIGSTVSKFIHNYTSKNLPWYQCGPKSAGNGALMRIASIIIPHLPSGTAELWVDAALSAMITHNDSGSIASCLSFVNLLWQLLKMESPPEPYWWLNTYVATAQKLEIDNSYRARSRAFANYQGPLWQFVAEQVDEAYTKRLSIEEACNAWYSGAYLLETVPSVIYILMRYGHNLEEAIVRAVNDTKDNDTIAAIVGAAVGALHGKEKIPERWIANLSGRTDIDDDGKVFKLLASTHKIWG